jgi:hypothetical protein
MPRNTLFALVLVVAAAPIATSEIASARGASSPYMGMKGAAITSAAISGFSGQRRFTPGRSRVRLQPRR